MPVLPYSELEIVKHGMARHAEKEANLLYPVPKLMTRQELESFYYRIADWSEENDK